MTDISSCYPYRHLFQYTFHISLSPRFVYVNNAKCGCTTAKASINRWHAAWHGKTLEYTSSGDIHERSLNPLLRPGQVGPEAEDIILRDPDVFRFTLIREPLGRLASAYASKMTWNTRERQLVNQKIGEEANAEVGYPAFLELICQDEEFRDSNEHWRPQTRQIASDHVPYDAICLQQSLDSDLLSIRDKLFPGLDIGVFDARRHFSNNSSGSSEFRATMTSSDVALVRRAFYDDFEFYEQVVRSRQPACSRLP